MYNDRTDAGGQLAERLIKMRLSDPIVYALPRGGVPVAAEVAKRLNAPLDLILVRKIGAPGSPEVALGAIVEGNPPETVINDDVMLLSGADDVFLNQARDLQINEIDRRRKLYSGDRPRLSASGRTAIVVDDGLATGATMKAALIALKRQGAARIIVALPVAAADSLESVVRLADEVVCLLPARDFRGVGAFYRDFHQLGDNETVEILRRVWTTEVDQTREPGSD